jgi:hypothetical protein
MLACLELCAGMPTCNSWNWLDYQTDGLGVCYLSFPPYNPLAPEAGFEYEGYNSGTYLECPV